MRPIWQAFSIALFFCGPALPAAEGDVGGPATSKEADILQEYARNVGKGWVSRILGLDLDSVARDIKQTTQAYTSLDTGNAGSRDAAAGARDPKPQYALHLDLEQYDDLARIREDPWDIPFAFRLSARSVVIPGVLELRSEAFVPLSWKDEMRVKAQMPFPVDRIIGLDTVLRKAGLDSPWVIRTVYSNRLGLSHFEIGLATQWMRVWDMSYVFHQRSGQEEPVNSHWMKIGLEF